MLGQLTLLVVGRTGQQTSLRAPGALREQRRLLELSRTEIIKRFFLLAWLLLKVHLDIWAFLEQWKYNAEHHSNQLLFFKAAEVVDGEVTAIQITERLGNWM
jgi:hypothetical protein